MAASSGTHAHLTRFKKRLEQCTTISKTEKGEAGNSTGVKTSPTAALYKKKCQAQLFLAKKKSILQSKKIAELTKERDSLLKELSEYKKKKSAADLSGPELSDSSETSTSGSSSSVASSSSSYTSSSTSSSENERKKTRRRKDKKKKKTVKAKKGEKEKKRKESLIRRALTPQQAIKRYQRVLREFQRGKNLRSSYADVGVDRNTVVNCAAIAELAIVSKTKYKELLEGFSRGQKLKLFISKCVDALNDPEMLAEVGRLKKNGKLLPIYQRK